MRLATIPPEVEEIEKEVITEIHNKKS